MKALSIAIVIALFVACGAGVYQSSKPSAPARMDAMVGRPGDRHTEIEELDREIQAQLGGASITAPTADEIEAARAMPLDFVAKVCTPPPAPSETCTDACKLGDSICHDAGRICELADELPGDAWAADKCASGKAACERAQQRCCDCR
ncbi:MAG TPA: hypothetical protein VL463_03405 [Kofleriaceae bacterium]|nr:hypothetical protein [Kofleriaceae bacterium]